MRATLSDVRQLGVRQDVVMASGCVRPRRAGLRVSRWWPSSDYRHEEGGTGPRGATQLTWNTETGSGSDKFQMGPGSTPAFPFNTEKSIKISGPAWRGNKDSKKKKGRKERRAGQKLRA